MKRSALGRRIGRRLAQTAGIRAVVRLHRNERGDMIDYVMVLAVIIPLVILVGNKMMAVLMDYFGMIAYFVTWPFI